LVLGNTEVNILHFELDTKKLSKVTKGSIII
jgi:hypothetical protein